MCNSFPLPQSLYKHDLGKPYHEGIEGEGELLHIGIYKHDLGQPHHEGIEGNYYT
jgi:hypothetical protein